MRVTQLFGKTVYEDSASEDMIASQILLYRAGYVRQLAAGIFSYLHLGQRSLKKIEQILREEMDAIGGAEIVMPVVHPAEIWKRTNRWYEIDQSMIRFQDRTERDMVLAMTHEEVVADLARTEIDSYKQLPKLVYQIYTKFRDEARSRCGLIRVREFTMKDSYSLDRDYEGLAKQYVNHYDAYFRIFSRMGLPVVSILSDTGMMGGRMAHEYMYLNPIGEDTVFVCTSGRYKANKEVATVRKTFAPAEPLALEKVHTPGTKTIAELAALLGVAESATAKMVFFFGEKDDKKGPIGQLVAVVVRGDMEANPIKVQKLSKVKNLRPATTEEISAAGMVAGYASPIGVAKGKAFVIVDDLVANSNNLVAGANETDYHFKNANYGRDFEADLVADVIFAYEGGPCPACADPACTLKAHRGVEVGNIFQLGTKYTEAMDATFVDNDGKRKPLIMGSYGIGVGRALACVAEHHHDDRGLVLPITVAPYEVVLVGLLESEEIAAACETLYRELRGHGVQVLFDDRDKKAASPGEKFGDADLMGIPVRITVSGRSMKNGGAEIKLRRGTDATVLPIDGVVDHVRQLVSELYAEIAGEVDKAERWSEQ
jgi:prolyl-tRNA synthetase